MEYVKRAKF